MARTVGPVSGLVFTALALWAAPLAAKNYGVHGPIFEIEEQSILELLMEELRAKEEAGEIEALKQDMQDKTRAAIVRPRPVDGVLHAEESYEYLVDLSVSVERDLADHNGVVFARAGTVINPLDYMYFEKTIVMIDGDDPRQVAFAAGIGDETDSYIVMVNGNPIETSNAYGRRYWFDIDGVMSAKFNIRHVPAIIREQYPHMRVTVVPPHQLGRIRHD